MNKEDVAHIYNGILLNHKKKWNNAICSEIDGPYLLSEIRQKQISWYHLYVESKNYINELIYNTETYSQTLKINSRLPKGKGLGDG